MAKLPTLAEIEAWTLANPNHTSRKEIARAFGIKGAERKALYQLLTTHDENSSTTPSFYQAKITAIDGNIHTLLSEENGSIEITHYGVEYTIGDQVLIKNDSTAQIIRKVEPEKTTLLARFVEDQKNGHLVEIGRGRPKLFKIASSPFKPKHDDILIIEELPSKRNQISRARIIEKLGNSADQDILASISVHNFDLPVAFSKEALQNAKTTNPLGVNREDLRKLPFLTIDPHDARDHDDAVFIEDKSDGWRLYVAIADVAAFVRPNTPLDLEALARGNSVYFPNQVIPMLPDELSGDACSLHENSDRPVIYVAMDIDQNGKKQSHKFGRAMINSRISLTYEDAQAIENDDISSKDNEIQAVVKTLFAAFRAMELATLKRGALHLDLPEQKLNFDDKGQLIHIAPSERLDAHKVIEEAMVMANVAAAEELEKRGSGALYRIHEDPKPEKIHTLRQIARSAGYKMPAAKQPSAGAINALLDYVNGNEKSEAVSMQVLRSLRQARYSEQNAGHFGLALKRYAHFTSPIRRYADLVLHRLLISSLNLGDDGYAYNADELQKIANHISTRERVAIQAERETTDRFVARFLHKFEGEEFPGVIRGVAKFGLFISIGSTGAEGFVPLRTVADDHYVLDRAKDIIRGRKTGRIMALGDKVVVKVLSTNELAGSIELQLLSHNGTGISNSQSRRRTFKKSNKAKRKRK